MSGPAITSSSIDAVGVRVLVGSARGTRLSGVSDSLATAGTARHSLVLEHALRPLFSYLKASPVPTGVFAASEDFGSTADGRLAAGRV